MKEALVQWTLLRNEDYLSECLGFDIANKIGQEITTDYGRVDFILENRAQQHLLVELETILNTQNKLDNCFKQIVNYRNVRFTKDTKYCILFAKETPKNRISQIENFGRKNEILIHTYSLDNVKKLYSDTIQRLSLNVGLALPSPRNYTVCFLRWLNKILKPFKDSNRNTLSANELFNLYSGGTTNFNCYKRLALDFEMIIEEKNGYTLTEYGEEYIKNFSPYVYHSDNVSSVVLTNQQKRLLLKILTNGNWEDKYHKINIYWFLRFIEITDGSWLPLHFPFDQNKLEIARGLFKVTYKHRTMKEFLNWCYNYCEELGLVERIKSSSDYDCLVLTPLGIDVNNIFSMDLSLKKSRMNLSFKYSE